MGVYNAEKYIAQQINSVINQTYKDWILYIRDDASTDGTLDILKDYASKSDKIFLINDDKGNLGCNGNYFHLLSHVDSEYYAFCNADDYWKNDKLALSLIAMEKEEKRNPEKAIIVHTDLSIADENLKIIYESLWKFDNLSPENYYTYNKIGICNPVAGATMLFNEKVRKMSFPAPLKTPFFDHWMALKVAENKGIFVPVKVPTVLYRQIGSNLAAIMVGKKNSLIYKLTNLRQTFMRNRREAIMLKKIGWGGYLKYLCYKINVLLSLRLNKS